MAMIKRIHPIAGAIAFFTIAVFWTSTIFSELFASKELITTVKSAIPWGFLILIPAIAAAGGSGFALSKGGRMGLVGTKLKRMPFIGANGILVLIPSAFYLASKANAGAFDTSFYVVQALELLAGATNLTLLGLNMRDGLRLTGKLGGGQGSSFNVALVGRDTVAPMLSCPQDMTVSTTENQTLVDYQVGVQDVLDVAPTFTTQPESRLFPVGTTQVLVTASDAAGNTATCRFTVTLTRTQASSSSGVGSSGTGSSGVSASGMGSSGMVFSSSTSGGGNAQPPDNQRPNRSICMCAGTSPSVGAGFPLLLAALVVVRRRARS